MTDKLLPCPFCGAHPHHGQTKVEYDQLHGEPFQRFRVWCPHNCASKLGANRELAVAAWNRRAQPVRVKASSILSQIALWSDDEGLELSMEQGDDLVRRILSALEHAPVVITDEMVERAAVAISGAPFPSKASYRKARDALQVALAPNGGSGDE